MLKILVVDDEVLERKALTKMINSAAKDAIVIGEAANGRKAIEMAREYRPDIIFMDIKMPGIDGVQAVKEIKKLDPGIRFIMVTAFNLFEFAKEVMQEGVKEYILKPSSKQDILAALSRVAEEVLKERKQREEEQSLRENLECAVSIAQKEWVSSLLMNQVQDLTFDQWSQLLGVEITSGYFMLFSLQPKGNHSLSDCEKQEWYHWLMDVLKSSSKKQEMMIGPITDIQVPVLFLYPKSDETTYFKTRAKAIIENVHMLFQTKSFKAELKVAVGLPYSDAHELNRSYHEAVLAMQQLLKTPNRKYLFCVKHKAMEIASPSGFLETEKKLMDAVREGDVHQALRIFDGFVLEHTAKNKQAVAFIKRSLEEWFILIPRMLHNLGISYESLPPIDEAEDIKLIVEQGKTHLMAVTRHVQLFRNNHLKGMLHRAKEYMEQHYADSITLESVADYVELSPPYFSKLFKDRFGVTFIDYLTEIRIKHAKAEMADHGKSLKEICYAIGYKDPNYFSRVFKKHTGKSPTQYRNHVC